MNHNAHLELPWPCYSLEDYCTIFFYPLNFQEKCLTSYYDPILAPYGHDLTELEFTQHSMFYYQKFLSWHCCSGDEIF